MTTQTISAGWLLLGLSLLVLGALVVYCVASERGSVAADDEVLTADLAAEFVAYAGESVEWAEATFDEYCGQALAMVHALDRAEATNVVPLQRQAVD